jgi:hypothetical protein
MLQATAMRMLQEETVPIQVPQEEAMLKMVMMTQLHPMEVMRIQIMTQSQPMQQIHRHLRPITRSRYIAWTLLMVHSQHFSGGPCRESASQ